MNKVAVLIGLGVLALIAMLVLAKVEPDAEFGGRSISLKPALADWKFGDKPRAIVGKIDFGSQVVQISEDEFIVIYFMSGEKIEKLVSQFGLKLSDNSNKEYSLKKSSPLAQFDDVEIGALIFEPREEEARELNVTLNQPEFDKPLKAKVAKLIGKTARDSDADTIFSLFDDGYQDISDYRISFNGWDFVETDRLGNTASQRGLSLEELVQKRATEAANDATLLSEATPIPHPLGIDAVANELAGGKQLRTKLTLRIENLQTNQVSFLFIVILEDGDVRAAQINK